MLPIQELWYGLHTPGLSDVAKRLSWVCRKTADVGQSVGTIVHLKTAAGAARFCATLSVFVEQYRRALPFMFIVAGLILLVSWSVRRNQVVERKYQ